MNLNNLDYLIYSSHKTSTQSLVKTLVYNKFNTIHCHDINDLKIHYTKCKITPSVFIQSLENYKNTNKKKLKIISIIRDPKKRLISSFFQSFHTDEVDFKKVKESDTTISTNNCEQLFVKYEDLIKNNTIPRNIESLDEISDIFNINILNHLENKGEYYYLNHDLFELFVLDFNKLTSREPCLYINKCLGINCTQNITKNLTCEKSYYEKYDIVKTKISKELNDIIESRYNTFYFSAFLE